MSHLMQPSHWTANIETGQEPARTPPDVGWRQPRRPTRCSPEKTWPPANRSRVRRANAHACDREATVGDQIPRGKTPSKTNLRERLEYHILPDDAVAALNILREAAGLELWHENDHEN